MGETAEQVTEMGGGPSSWEVQPFDSRSGPHLAVMWLEVVWKECEL